MTNNEIKLDKKATDYLKDKLGGGGQGGSPIEAGTGINITGEDTKTISIDESVVAKKDDIGNGTITITQGGTTKGSFTLNQKTGKTIELDAGGGSQGKLTLYIIHYEKDNIKFTLQGLAYSTIDYGSGYDYGDALTELWEGVIQSEDNYEFPLIDVTGASGNEKAYLYAESAVLKIHYKDNDYTWMYDTCGFGAYGWATYLRIKDFPNNS